MIDTINEHHDIKFVWVYFSRRFDIVLTSSTRVEQSRILTRIWNDKAMVRSYWCDDNDDIIIVL